MSHPDHARFVTQRVQFHDCDPLGIVWHGRYFEYFEAARCELLRSVRLDVADMIELNFRMVVTEVRCRYNTPMRCGDELRIWAWFNEVEPLLKVSYDIENLTTGRKCVRAFTRLALTDARGALLPLVPRAVRERLPSLTDELPPPSRPTTPSPSSARRTAAILNPEPSGGRES